ncbi:hypothetical protein [Rhodoblastus sp.]|uniref:hypothetical protein n=1 Tax=Rhodoblastus sp. TaxID=1962975 RepID=UPI003F9885AD
MAEILTVLTFKSARHIVGDGGTQSWVISPRRARRCAYVVCVRHQQGPYKAEGNEPHKHAFLVGKVSGVVPSSETSDRFRVEMSEYAIFDGPHIQLNSASPTQYFPSLSSVGIDEASLHWKPIHALPDEDGSIPRGGVSPTGNALQDVGDGGGVPTVSLIMQAKKLVADGLHVPLSSVEIIVRA